MKQILFFLFVIAFATNISVAQESAVELIRTAVELNKHDDFATSSLLCDKAIKINPEMTGAYFLRGYNNFLLEKYKEAIQDFTLTLIRDPNYFEAIYYRAKARQAKGDYIGAIQDFNSARGLSSSKTTFFMIKGMFASVFGGTSKE